VGEVLHGSLLQLLLEHCDFLNVDISQDSVATHLRCGKIFKYELVANLPVSIPVKEFWKLLNIWGSYGQEFGVLFFETQCRRKQHCNVSACMSQNVDSKLQTQNADWKLAKLKFQTAFINWLCRPYINQYSFKNLNACITPTTSTPRQSYTAIWFMTQSIQQREPQTLWTVTSSSECVIEMHRNTCLISFKW